MPNKLTNHFKIQIQAPGLLKYILKSSDYPTFVIRQCNIFLRA